MLSARRRTEANNIGRLLFAICKECFPEWRPDHLMEHFASGRAGKAMMRSEQARAGSAGDGIGVGGEEMENEEDDEDSEATELEGPADLTAFNVLRAISNPKVSTPTLRLLLSLLPRARDVGSRRGWTLSRVNASLERISQGIAGVHKRDWAAAHRLQLEGNMGRTPQKVKGNVPKQIRNFVTDEHLRFYVRCILSASNRKDIVNSFASVSLDDGTRVMIPVYIRTRRQEEIVDNLREQASRMGYPEPSPSTAARLVRWILLDQETQKKGLDNAQVRSHLFRLVLFDCFKEYTKVLQ